MSIFETWIPVFFETLFNHAFVRGGSSQNAARHSSFPHSFIVTRSFVLRGYSGAKDTNSVSEFFGTSRKK